MISNIFINNCFTDTVYAYSSQAPEKHQGFTINGTLKQALRAKDWWVGGDTWWAVSKRSSPFKRYHNNKRPLSPQSHAFPTAPPKYYFYSLSVPRSLINSAIQQAHELSGHLGQKKTIKKAEELYYWANLMVDVCKYVKECIKSQRFKGSSGLQQQWKELSSVNKPLERLGIDLTDMTAGVQGYRYVLTVVDHYSRFVSFPPQNKTHTKHY